MVRREELESEGWELQSVLSEPRLSEAVELYREIGYEVRVFPFDPEEEGCNGCTDCLKDSTIGVFAVYTRKEGGENGQVRQGVEEGR